VCAAGSFMSVRCCAVIGCAVICTSCVIALRCHLHFVRHCASLSLALRASLAALSFMLRMSFVILFVSCGGGWNLLSEDSISGMLPGSFHPAVADGNLLFGVQFADYFIH
jgi:hypothetical protein